MAGEAGDEQVGALMNQKFDAGVPNTNIIMAVDAKPADAKEAAHGDKAYDPYLVVPKLLYFTSSLLINALHNYKAQFLVDRQQVAIDQVGLVYAVVGINFIGSIFWSRLADRFHSHRTISMISPLLYGLSTCAYLLPIPAWIPGQVYAMMVMSMAHFSSSAIFPLLDAQVFALLKLHGSQHRGLFGRQRLFGTLAIPLSSFIAFKLLGKENYTRLFANMLVCMVLYIAVVFFGIPSDLKVGTKDKHEPLADGKKPSLASIFKQLSPALPLLLLFVWSSGFLRALMNIYQNFMVDKLLFGRSGPLYLSLVRAASEAAVFFYSQSLLDAIGLHWALVISQVAGIVRVLGYGWMPRKQASLLIIAAPLELLKGVNSGLVVSAATRLGNQMAPLNAHGTVHGLLAGTYTGLAMATGGCLSSLMISLLGGDVFSRLQGMFLISAAASSVILFLFMCSVRVFGKFY